MRRTSSTTSSLEAINIIIDLLAPVSHFDTANGRFYTLLCYLRRPAVPKSGSRKRLPERVLEFVQGNGLVFAGETLLVGVSGGPDSVCLLHVLKTIIARLGIEIHVAHLNHMLRGAESEADAEYVSALARQLGVNVTSGERDVRGYRMEHRLSLEEAARDVRYQFFAEVARQVGARKVAVGHTMDDQVETILMRLLRGAGTLGLQGMQPRATWAARGGEGHFEIVRPLLEVTRQEVYAYCQEHGLSPREDSSNLSPSYLRNRIRHELLPLLRSYNPKIDEALVRTADTLATELSYLDSQVSQVWQRVVAEEDQALILDGSEIKTLHPALQRHLLRQVVSRLLGSLEDIEWKHIEKMRKALALPSGKRVVLPRGLTLYAEKGCCRASVT
ncbi:MAG: tRNA lysidine(34) synthetase TilS [Chloroflexi bacterium]|nr:MAG: tRNA lysidine(34) synthetase TilS [Chloroflexota bacterium]